MYNFNYEYMTFLYVVHVYMFCNVVLYCIALPARVLFAIKIIIIIIIIIKKLSNTSITFSVLYIEILIAEISFAPIIIKSVLLDSVWLCILFSFHSIHSRSICIGDVTNIRISIHSTLNVILVLESFLNLQASCVFDFKVYTCEKKG
jgi:hypothetical protein